MCVVSMVMDSRTDDWMRRLQDPRVWPAPVADPPVSWPPSPPVPLVTQEEVEEFRRLLDRAREYDRRMGQPDCELEEKRQALKRLADALGIDVSFL